MSPGILDDKAGDSEQPQVIRTAHTLNLEAMIPATFVCFLFPLLSSHFNFLKYYVL